MPGQRGPQLGDVRVDRAKLCVTLGELLLFLCDRCLQERDGGITLGDGGVALGDESIPLHQLCPKLCNQQVFGIGSPHAKTDATVCRPRRAESLRGTLQLRSIRRERLPLEQLAVL